VFEETIRDRRAERHEATRAEIVDAAWELVREHGLAGLSLRDLARRVGLQAPSLYGYFPSKNAIYDAMFAAGWQALVEQVSPLREPNGDEALFRAACRAFVEFCVEDPPRYLLMCQRTIPGFEPSPEAYAPAVEALGRTRAQLAALGITDQKHLDLFTALTTGLVDQQLSNDPGGRRWSRLLDEALDMYLDHVRPRRRKR
jgi:AcrR family transcriptional regulator